MKKIFKSIFVISAFMMISFASNAQDDTGTTPYAGTKHDYTVNPTYNATTSSNTFTWSVLIADGTAAADASVYDFFTVADNTVALGSVTSIEDLVGVSILWNLSGNYIVEVREENANCSTVRRFAVSVSSNAFDVTIAGIELADCSSATGFIVDDTDSNLGTTTRTFSIKMTTDGTATPTWKPEWKFTYDVTVDNGATPTVTFNNGNDVSKTVTVNAGTIETTMTVVFPNALGVSQDVFASLTLISETEHSTPDPEALNDATVVVYSMPATTNIITD